MADTLAEALPEEIIRCMRLRDHYLADAPVGSANFYAAGRLTADLHAAIRAAPGADVVECLRTYETLKRWAS